MNQWAREDLLERAKNDANAQYELAQLAIENKRYSYAIVLLRAAKQQGHIAANATLIAPLTNLQINHEVVVN